MPAPDRRCISMNPQVGVLWHRGFIQNPGCQIFRGEIVNILQSCWGLSGTVCVVGAFASNNGRRIRKIVLGHFDTNSFVWRKHVLWRKERLSTSSILTKSSARRQFSSFIFRLPSNHITKLRRCCGAIYDPVVVFSEVSRIPLPWFS